MYLLIYRGQQNLSERKSMSRLMNRKVNREPVRSPSPDTANKNIIASTANPLNDALTKTRLSHSSTFSQQHLFAGSQQLMQSLQNSQDQYHILFKQYHILLEQNANLKNQIYSLKSENKKQPDYAYDRVRMGNQGGDIKMIHQYQRRIGEMMDEIRRIQQKLKSVLYIKDELERENNELRRRNGHSTDKLSKSPPPNVNLDKNYYGKLNEKVENQLSGELNRLRLQFEKRIEVILNELSNRTYRIETNQNQIKSMLQNKHFSTPSFQQSKDPYLSATRQRSPTPDIKQFSVKAFNSYPLQRQTQQLNRKIESQTSKINNYERQIDSLKRSLQNSRQQKYECQNCQRLQRKILDLESNLRFKDATIQNLQKQVVFYKTQLQNKNAAFNRALKEYLTSLTMIKGTLSNQEINQYINNTEITLSDIEGFNQKLEEMQEQNSRMLNELRDKQVEQRMQILKLKKQNEIYQTTIHEHVQQIEQLRIMISNLSKNNKTQITTERHHRRQITGQTGKFRQCLHVAITKIQNLEQSISKTLK